MITLSSHSPIASLAKWRLTPAGKAFTEQAYAMLSSELQLTFGYHLLAVGDVDMVPLRQIVRTQTIHTMNWHVIDDRHNQLKWPFADDSIDAVLLYHTLLHPSTHHWLFAEAYRVLMPEGKLFIVDFNAQSWWAARRLLGKAFQHLPAGCMSYQLTRQLSKAGFADSHHQFFYRAAARYARITDVPMPIRYQIFGAGILSTAYKRESMIKPIKLRFLRQKKSVQAAIAQQSQSPDHQQSSE